MNHPGRTGNRAASTRRHKPGHPETVTGHHPSAATHEQGARGFNQNEAVTAFLRELNHPMNAEIAYLRQMILAANDQMSEHIKWKAPSFRHGGEDRITFNLRPRDRILLIFHRGAKAHPDDGFLVDDPTGPLTWAAPDRATLTLGTLAEVRAHEAAIVHLVNAWVEAASAS